MQPSSEEAYIAEGSQEISPSINITREFEVTDFNINLGYGYFVTNFLKPEAEFSIGIIESDGLDIDQEGFLFGASVYYNEGNRIIPFIGLRLGVGSVGLSVSGASVRSTSFVTSVKAGMLLWINKNINLSVPVEYQRWSLGENGVGGTNHIKVPIGLSILF